jgi:hypothetical protein
LIGLALAAVGGWLFGHPSADGINRAALEQHPSPNTVAEVEALPPGTRFVITGTLTNNPPVDVPEWTSNDPMPDYIAYRAYAHQSFQEPDTPVAFNFPALTLRIGGGTVQLAPAPEIAVNAPDNVRPPDIRSFHSYQHNAPKIYGYTNGEDVTVIADVGEDGQLIPVRYAMVSTYLYDLPGWDPWHIAQNLGLGFVGLVLFLLALVAEFPPPHEEPTATT